MTERRSSKRITSNIDTRFFMGNMFYTGNVKNLSKEGMFIKTNMLVPSGSLFVVIISVKEKLLRMLSRARRIVEKESSLSGIGIEIIDPPQQYTDFVEDLSAY